MTFLSNFHGRRCPRIPKQILAFFVARFLGEGGPLLQSLAAAFSPQTPQPRRCVWPFSAVFTSFALLIPKSMPLGMCARGRTAAQTGVGGLPGLGCKAPGLMAPGKDIGVERLLGRWAVL